jgi:hypothetical protein
MTFIINSIIEKSFENLGIECMQFRFLDNKYVELYLTDYEEHQKIQESLEDNKACDENYPTNTGKIALTLVKNSEVKTTTKKVDAKTVAKSVVDAKHAPASLIKKSVSYSVIASNTVQNAAVVVNNYGLRPKIRDELMPMICENKSECNVIKEIKANMFNKYTSGGNVSVDKAKWDRFIADLGLYLAVVDNADAKEYVKYLLKEAVSESFKKL